MYKKRLTQSPQRTERKMKIARLCVLCALRGKSPCIKDPEKDPEMIRAGCGDPRYRVQPRLPGSVVGELEYLPRSKTPQVTAGRTAMSAGDMYFQSYFEEVTSECVIAWTDNAMRFCTPTLRISFATCAFTVRSSIPSTAPISLFDLPTTSSSRTSFSRSVNVTLPAGKIRPGDEVTRSMNIDSTRRGAHTDP